MPTRAEQVFTEVAAPLQGMPVFMAGSFAAALTYDKDFGDVDFFVPTPQVLISTVQTLLDNGYVMDDKYSRVWYRWLKYGFNNWKTNSMKLQSLSGIEVNVVYKLVDGHPTRSLAEVLESFDFGLLGRGYDMQAGKWRDLRGYLFPNDPLNGPFGMMPDREENWKQGHFGWYNGLRQPYRYAHYIYDYGYDLSLVKPVLVQGYAINASYHLSSSDQERQSKGEIYSKLGELIEDDAYPELIQTYYQLDLNDPLDEIKAALD